MPGRSGLLGKSGMLNSSNRSTRCWLVASAAMLLVPATVEAGYVRKALRGLAFLGFDSQISRDAIGDGYTFRTVTVFPDVAVDVGASQLSIGGPMSLELYAGGRGPSNYKIRFQTAVRSDLPSQALNYDLTTNVGLFENSTTGSLLLDGELSFNTLGFYNVELEYSSRQQTVLSGLVDQDGERDFDIGPINLRGNIFVDLIALATAPILGESADANPFVALTGRESLKTSEGLLRLGDSHPEDVVFQGIQSAPASPANGQAAVVPEPTVLALMLLGLPFVLGIHRRRTRAA